VKKAYREYEEYPDAKQHFDAHMERSAKKYVDGLQRAGLQPNAKLSKVISERAAQEASESYNQEFLAVRDHNTHLFEENHHSRMDQIERSSARWRALSNIPIPAAFLLVAWYLYAHANVTMAMLFGAGAIGMFVLGAAFDRARK
jgi:Flp pilus assembly protein TadB